MKSGPERKDLLELARKLEKAAKASKAPVWKRVAELLLKPRRKRVEVNLSKIDAHAKEGDTVVVPGKVLSVGSLTKKITVACFSCSAGVPKKVSSASATIIPITKLLEQNPSGKLVKIIV